MMASSGVVVLLQATCESLFLLFLYTHIGGNLYAVDSKLFESIRSNCAEEGEHFRHTQLQRLQQGRKVNTID